MIWRFCSHTCILGLAMDDNLSFSRSVRPAYRGWYGLAIVVTWFLAMVPMLYENEEIPLAIYDEARMGVNAIHMMQDGDWLVSHYDGQPDHWASKPTLLIIGQATLFRLFGISKFSLRRPSFIMTGLLYLLLFWFARRIGRPWLGPISVLVFATAPGALEAHGIRYGEYDALLLFFSVAYTLFFFLYLQSDDRAEKNRFFALTVLLLILGWLSKSVASAFMLPGIFVYCLLSRQLVGVLRDRRLYVGVLSFFVVIGSYYLLREQQDPGYLRDVWGNELGGRFGQTMEGHEGPFLYYIARLINNRFWPWLVLLPLSVWLAIRYRDELVSYLLVICFTFFLIISTAATKLDWYDLPTYPLLALATGSGVLWLLRKWPAGWPQRWRLPAMMVVVAGLFLVPYSLVLKRTDRDIAQYAYAKESYYYEYLRHFGDDMDHYLVSNIGYNASVQFAVMQWQARGKDMGTIYPGKHVQEGQRILICEPAGYQMLEESHHFEQLHEWKSCRYLLMGAARVE